MKRLIPLVFLCCLAASCSGSDAATTTVSTTVPTATTGTPATTVTTTTTAVATATTGSAAATAEEVSFASGDIELAGTLRLPEGDNAPGIVLIHGSGPNSREETMAGQLNMGFGFEIPVFTEIGDALQEAGFAVLSYDKRTCGPFNGCADNGYTLPGDDLVVDDFIADAQAAVDYLRQRAEVDPDRISVVGHSQGGEFIPVLLKADPGLAKGVMLAGPYSSADQVIEFQYTSSADLLVDLGMTEEQAQSAPGMADLAAMVDGLAAIRGGSDEPVAGVSAAFWRSWFDLDDAKISAVPDLTQPVLILGGGYDWNVPPTEAELWDGLFTDAGAQHTTVVLDCVTHALNCVTETDLAVLSADDIGEHVSTEVTDALVEFLSG